METEFDAAGTARRLLREARSAALATLSPDGSPFASLVAVATLPDGAPFLLLSRLARHTQNLRADSRTSLLIAEDGGGDPLAAARVTLIGRAATTGDQSARRRFLARNPEAEAYADFKDFAFWRLEPAEAHLVAGFGRIIGLPATQIMIDVMGAGELLAAEEEAVAHMNRDHADAVESIATRLLGGQEGRWRMIGIDPEGCEFTLDGTIRRLEFAERVTTPGELRKALAELAQRARTG